MPRVVMLCLDGFPVRRIGPELTPNLLRLAESGGLAPNGGLADMPSSTYLNHASMLTGAGVDAHQVLPGGVPPRPPWERESTTNTVFEQLAAAGISARAVLGDQHLVRVLRLDGQQHTPVWPPTPAVPDGVRTDDHGWIVDNETFPRVLDAVASGARFVFGHFNDPDTFGHDFGPDSDAAADAYRFADWAVGKVMDLLAEDWDDTVLIAVSDHDMVPRTDTEPVLIEDDSITLAVPEGGAAWLWPAPGATDVDTTAAALRTPGVRDVIVEGGLPLAILEPGRIAYWDTLPAKGFHGGLEARATVAVVGGGDPLAREIGRRIAAVPPSIRDWAPLIQNALGASAVVA